MSDALRTTPPAAADARAAWPDARPLRTDGRPGWLGTRAAGVALLLVAGAAGLWLAPRACLAAWLGAWWFCLGIGLGAGANARVHALTGGRWGTVLAGPQRALAARMPWVLLAFGPLLAGLGTLYPWIGDRAAWRASMDAPAFAEAWFSPTFVAARWLGYAALAWCGARQHGRVQRPGAGAAALGLGVHLVVGSLAATDFLVSLVAGWNSTVFGWLALVGQLGAGAAVAIALAARRAASTPAAETAPTRELPPVWRDLGNLLLMDVMLQAYLQFMQFLIIWAENLPREIRWFLPRVQGGWGAVSVALVVLQFAAPLLVLLWRRQKDDPRRLARIATGFAAAQALGAAWLVVPSVAPHDAAAWWLVPAITAGMFAAIYGGVEAEAR